MLAVIVGVLVLSVKPTIVTAATEHLNAAEHRTSHYLRGHGSNSSVDHQKHRTASVKGRNNLHQIALASLAFPQLYNCKSPGPPMIFASEVTEEKFQNSLSNEDVWLHRHIFSKLPPSESMSGFFIEIGAVDGLQYSNTNFFEKRYDWRGLLIEGQPHNAIGLRHNLPIHRSNAVAFTNSICKLDGNQAHSKVTFTEGGGAVATTLQGAKKGFLDSWHSDMKERLGGKNITCVPMQSLLDLTGVLDVELFSLDVEGAELEVLQTIRFDVTNIRVAVIELDGHDPEKNVKVRDHMFGHGFITSEAAHLGKITDACNVTTYGPLWSCMANEVFINPHYTKRKNDRERSLKSAHVDRYYVNGTGLACV